jgi:uncharacterized surface protein with fasciclin (FAS1) repeats
MRWIKTLMAISAISLIAACGSDDDGPTKNIVETAQSLPQFSILVEAVVAADLVDELSQPGPLTVFAPTNDAFVALLTELGITKDQLFADKALLTTVLTYHVLPAQVKAADIPVGKAISSVQGGVFKIDTVAGKLAITDGRNRISNITVTDVLATNGVIHAIDKVILPANKTIVETAQSMPDKFSILVEAVVAADLVDALNAAGPLTVFAPTNDAFLALLAELNVTKDELLADKDLLTSVLTYHVLLGRVMKADVQLNTPIRTLEGGTFTIDASLTITDERTRKAAIGPTDVFASNGVIHVIDKVILPAP